MAIHGYSGSWAPAGESGNFSHRANTFSVGVFELLKKRKGGYKHGAVIVRVKGSTSNPEAVFAKAREIVAKLDAGEKVNFKSVTVR